MISVAVMREVRRQFVHFLFGSVFIVLTAVLGVDACIIVIAAALSIGAMVSFQIKHGYRVFLFSEILDRVERKREQAYPGKGALVFFLGTLSMMLLFRQEQTIVLGALIVSVYGDSASTVAGVHFGRHRTVGKKTVEGTLGGIALSMLFLAILFEWWIALAAAVIGMLAELLPLEDSFTIPIATAIALTLLL